MSWSPAQATPKNSARGILARTTFSANPPASPTRIPPVWASPSMISDAGITG